MISYSNNMDSYDMMDMSIDEATEYFILGVNNAIHEFDMSVALTQYKYLAENGYEMPLNEGIGDSISAMFNKFKDWISHYTMKVTDWFREKYESVRQWFKKFGLSQSDLEERVKKLDTIDNSKKQITCKIVKGGCSAILKRFKETLYTDFDKEELTTFVTNDADARRIASRDMIIYAEKGGTIMHSASGAPKITITEEIAKLAINDVFDNEGIKDLNTAKQGAIKTIQKDLKDVYDSNDEDKSWKIKGLKNKISAISSYYSEILRVYRDHYNSCIAVCKKLKSTSELRDKNESYTYSYGINNLSNLFG